MSATSSAGNLPTSAARQDGLGPTGRASVPDTASAHRSAGRARVGDYGPRYPEAPPAPEYGGPGGPEGPDGRFGPAGTPRRRPRWDRIALITVAAILVLALLAGIGLWLYASKLNGDLKRTDAFAGVAEARPPQAANGALNILLVGTDSRDPDAPLDRGSEWRADTLIVMHVPSSRDKAYLVSVPRDLYVPIPEEPGAACDSGRRAKVNAAFAFGGLPLAVRTVECFTDVRIDNVVAIDFAGFKEVTDALGGVDLPVEQDTRSIHKPYRTWKKGINHMNGGQALDWIRQRKQFPDGDFARMRHQQQFLRALMDKAASTGTLANPAKLVSFLSATTDAVTVDESFSLVDMGLKFRKLRGDELQFLTNPNIGSDTIDGESVVVSDREKALAMYQAMAGDRMAEWIAANPPTRNGGN
jgi:LCP family protein required for cell wall assembly